MQGENKMNTQKEVRPFGLRDKIGYMFGDFGNDFTFVVASLFLMVFYTQVLGISAELVGVLFVIARLIDAFTDITMGRIVDKMKPGKGGRFKPWIRWASGPVALASFLMYQSGLANASMTVTLYQLKQAGLIDLDVKNPKNGELFPNDMLITATNENGVINYKVDVEGSNKINYQSGEKQHCQ